MKKILLALGLLAVCVYVFAANDFLINFGGAGKDSVWTMKYEDAWEYIYIDTMTFHAKNGDSIVDLTNISGEGYNFQMRSLNGAGDSGSVKIGFDAHQGIWHDDSVARNIDWSAVGLNTADDYFFAPIKAKKIYVRPVVGGNADSTCILELKFFH